MESVELFVCLFVTKGEKVIFSPGAEQFPKHIWNVFLKWLSSNMCVCVPQLHFVDDAVTAAGILDTYQNLSRQKKGTIYLFLCQTHTNSLLL